MRLPCPLCGARDLREFACKGAARYLDRPSDGSIEAWDDYLHLRENPAGSARELWYHDACGAWLVVERDTVTHAVQGVALAAERSA